MIQVSHYKAGKWVRKGFREMARIFYLTGKVEVILEPARKGA